MTNRTMGFAALLAVIGVSIVFGMILGGRLNAPQVVLAAPQDGVLRLAPASAIASPVASFADTVERALPAVVSVTSTQHQQEGNEGDDRSPREEFFRWFFPEPEELDPRRGPRQRTPQPRIGEGSGFVISPDGHVLTNNHVVQDSDTVEVRFHDGRKYVARIVGTDPSIDLALLKIEPDGAVLPTLPLGDSRELRVGEWVIAIGNPLEFEQTVTVGVVSGKGRRVPIGDTDQGVVSFIQTDAAINFGNSGGPLLDASGNVVGINTAIRRANYAEGIGFALPISQTRAVIDQLMTRGYVKRGFIGITMNPDEIDENAREYYGLPDASGVIVSAVTESGPAERAGVRVGDVIRRVDGDPINDNLDLISKIAARQPGDRVRLDLFREGREVKVTATLGDREEGLQARAEPEGAPRRRGGSEDEIEESTGLGLTVEGLTRRTRERMGLSAQRRGVVITDLDYASEAADKGLRPDMIIAGVNDSEVDNVADWRKALDRLTPGQPVKLSVVLAQPDGTERTIFVYLRAPRE